jgi:hypothetical protein
MFGGATISLILPKLIRSVARDGIYNFCLAGNPPAVFSINDTRQAAAFNGRLPKPKPTFLL